MEEVTRFVIFADFCIAVENAKSGHENHQHAYNSERRTELLVHCLGTLSDLYETMREQNLPCPNESEFRLAFKLQSEAHPVAVGFIISWCK